MNLIYSKFMEIVSWKSAITLAVIFIIIYIYANGSLLTRLKQYSKGIGYLEAKIIYSPNKTYEVLSDYGEAGRQFYAKILIYLDFIFPLEYSMLFMILIALVFKMWLPLNNELRRLYLIPILAGLFDWAENICLLIILYYYPKKLNRIAITASIMTITKSIITMISILLIIIGLVGLSIKTIVV